ncbi:ComF family protein [Listeria sp. PSOL-1]|uniref:ComF family protein n=1 Tax=Listeria sp. PSOL-1 TaxID=1844999 RepID=UPI0013D6271C|nr:phosphoribosyltransferase family protein [Listeria sp. PSOL-1]
MASQHCLWCGKPYRIMISWSFKKWLVPHQRICERCAKQLEVLNEPTCIRCNKANIDGECRDCQRRKEYFIQKNTSLYRYNDFAKELMTQYKYRGDYVLAELFAPPMKKFFKQRMKDFIISPIPLAANRLQERGFNQVSAMLTYANVPYQYLLKRDEGDKQSKRTRNERLQMIQVFQLNTTDIHHIKGKNIFLVDDIYTTGVTLNLAAERLILAGAKMVYSFTIFR